MNLTISSTLVIPSRELLWRFSKSSGSGGQKINKTSTKVELLFVIEDCSSLSLAQKTLLRKQLSSRIINDAIYVVAQESRAQYQNRKLALSRLTDLIRKGLKTETKQRKLTTPTRASKLRRVDLKKKRGKLKKTRQVNSVFEC